MENPSDPLIEALARLTVLVKQQERSIQYLLQMFAGVLNRDNPEHAYKYLRTREREYVNGAPEIAELRLVLEAIDRAKGIS